MESQKQSKNIFQKLDQKQFIISSSNLSDHFLPNQNIMTPQEIKNYQKALSFSKLSIPSQLYMRNVKIYQNDHLHQIYTKNSPSQYHKKLPHLVMMHGFGGTSLTFIRIFNYLFPYYQVHALDTFGIGYSSYGNYSSSFSEKETIDYYIDAVQQWRKKMKIQEFQLVGHSFGGYLALQYALKYPNIVKRLMLLSPAGSHHANFQLLKNEKQKNISLRQRLFVSFIKNMYNMSFKPMKAYNNYFYGQRISQIMLGARLKLHGEQKTVWKNYIQNLGKRSSFGQKGFYKIFKWPIQPSITIKDILQKNKFNHPVQIYYGDNDWMYQNYKAYEIKDQLKHVTVQIVRNAGHQLIFDNPFQVASKITKYWRRH